MSFELAHAYVSLSVSTGGMRGDVQKALKGVELDAAKTGQSMGSKISSGMGSTLKKSAIGVGVAAGAALGAGLTKGVQRLSAIEGAEAKLKGLGSSAAKVGGIMENALASVKGTAFGLEEAGTVAAAMVASGIKPGRKLEGVLKTVGDTAAIAGVSMQDMGSIFGKVAATGKLQGDELMQLSDNGIPALALLSEHLGVTASKVRKLVSDGGVDFATFAAAMKSGVGGAALAMADTTGGALKNMGAAAGRLGATLAGPFYDQAGGAFRGITELLDDLNTSAGPVMEGIAGWIENAAVPALSELGGEASAAFSEFAKSDLARTSIARLQGVFGSLSATAGEVWPSLQRIGGALLDASEAIGVSGWSLFLTTLEAASVAAAALEPPLSVVADLMESQPALVTSALAAWLGFRTMPALLGRTSTAVAALSARATVARTAAADFGGAWRTSIQYMQQSRPELSRGGAAVRILGENAKAAARGGLSSLRSGASKLATALGGPLNIALAGAAIAVGSAVAANQRLESSQENLREASVALATSQVDMWDQISDASGVADAVVAQVDAVRASMDAAIAGEQRGFGSWVSSIFRDLDDQLIDNLAFSGPELGDAGEMQRMANEVADAAKLAKGALDELGVSNDDVAAAISGSAGDWQSFRSRLEGVSEGGSEAVAKLQPLRDEYIQLAEAQRIATPGSLELSSAVDVLADSASSADDKLDALKGALEALGIIETDAEAKAFELAEAVDKIVDSATEGASAAGGLGDALLDASGKLDPTKDNARALHGELATLGDKFLETARASGDAAGAYDSTLPALEALASKYGLTIEQVRELAAAQGMVPEQVDLLLNVEGADESRQKLAEVALQLGAIPENEPKTITMRVEDEAARAALSDIGLQVDAIEGQPGMVRITADNSLAVAGMNAVAGQLSGLDASVATPDITADATSFRITDQEVLDSLARLDTSRADPAMGAVIDGFLSGRDVTMAELQKIDGITADPHISAEISEALQKAQVVNAALDRAARARTATITLVHRGSSQYSSSGTAVGQHYAIGGRHDGYRLPTTGPGTSITDGFLALDSDNVPAARLDAGEWVINGRSSRKYNRELKAINEGRFPKLPGFADGGLNADELDRKARGIEGAPYTWGGWLDPASKPWHTDCTGAASRLMNLAVNGTMDAIWRFATGNAGSVLADAGFVRGRWSEGMLGVGYTHNPGGPGGGHAASTLPNGINVEMGGARGNGQYGGGAAGANDSQFRNQFIFKVEDPFDWSDKEYSGRRGRGLVRGKSDIGVPDRVAAAYSSGRSSQSGLPAINDTPTTWSGFVGKASEIVASNLTSDVLGFFGIPDKIPPMFLAWQALHEAPEGGGPTEWELSVAAAQVAKWDGQIDLQEELLRGGQRALHAMESSPLGNPSIADSLRAEERLDALRADLERSRLEHQKAMSHMDSLLDARLEGLDDTGLSSIEKAEFATTKAENDILDKEESLRKAERSLHKTQNPEKGEPDPEDIEDAEARVGKITRDLEEAKVKLRQAQAKEDKVRREALDGFSMAGGFWNGGSITAGSGLRDDVPLVAAQGEFIVNRAAAAKNRGQLEAINSGGSIAPVVIQIDASGGDWVSVDQLQRACVATENRVRMEIKNRRPPAAALTRGGVM